MKDVAPKIRKPSFMKRWPVLGRIIRAILVVVGIVLVLSFVVLSSPPVQNWIAGLVTEKLKENLGNSVEVENIQFVPFSKLKLEGVYVEDLNKDTLLYVPTLSAKFKLFDLLKNKITVNRLEIISPLVNVVVDADSVPNYAFLLEKLRTDEPKQFNMDVQVDEAMLINARIRYNDVCYAPLTGQFDPHHINVSELNLLVAIEEFKKGSIDAAIKHFSAKESCGFELVNFEAHLIFDTLQLSMPTLRLELPNSLVDVDALHIELPPVNRPDTFDYGTLAIDLNLPNASFVLSDIGAFVPAVKFVKKPITLSAQVTGSFNDINLNTFTLAYNNYNLLDANVSIVDLQNRDDAHFKANVRYLKANTWVIQDFVSELQHKPFVLPQPVVKLGEIRYTGSANGKIYNVNLQGGFHTNMGTITTIGELSRIFVNKETNAKNTEFVGIIETQDFKLGEMLANQDLGNISFRLEADGKIDTLSNLDLQANGALTSFQFRKYDYQDLKIKGHYTDKMFEGSVSMHDPNLWFDFDGLVNMHEKLPIFDFNLGIDTLHLGELNLVKDKFVDSDVRLYADINLKGNSLDNLNGVAQFNNVYVRSGEHEAEISDLKLTSQMEKKQENRLRIQSDMIDFDCRGYYSYTSLPVTIQKLCARYLPNFFTDEQKRQLDRQRTDNQMSIQLFTHQLNTLLDALEVPFDLRNDLTVKGLIDEPNNKFELGVLVPSFDKPHLSLRNVALNLNNHADKLQLALSLKKLVDQTKPASVQMGDLKAYLNVGAVNDSIMTTIRFVNDSVHQLTKGEVDLLANFTSHQGKPIVTVDVLPNDLVLLSTPWKIDESKVVYNAANSTLDVKDFRFYTVTQDADNQQHLFANGRGSKNERDSILVDLKDMELNWLVGISGFHEIDFGGLITGYASVCNLFNQFVLNADLRLRNFAMNGNYIGHAIARAEWLHETPALHYFGDVYHDDDEVHLAHLDGQFVPKKQQWNLGIDSEGVPLTFVNKWIGGIFGTITGDAYGRVDIDGDTLGAIVTANALVKNGSLTIDPIGTTYYFNDTVVLKPDSILFRNMHFTDIDGNKVDADAFVAHNRFKNFSYGVGVKCYNAQVINLPRTPDNMFYGKMYANGDVSIRGNERFCNIDVQASTQPKSNFGLSLNQTSTAVDNDYITFKKKTKMPSRATAQTAKKSSSRLNLGLNVEVTPDVQVRLDIDQRTGDAIVARGEGTLVMTYKTPGNDINLRGQLGINSGNVTMTLSNLLRKEFRVEPGGAVTFNGDPMNTQLAVRAYYLTNASLRDLMGEQFQSTGFSGTFVPVHCVLDLKGSLRRPEIGYDLELPNADETVRQQVQSIVNTDEMKMREILYLLAFNKFYTPDYLQASGSVDGAAESYALLSSTVTGQINNWLSKVTNDFQLGFNVHSSGTGDQESREYEGQFMYKPTNRLEINGNFGYRNNDISNRPFFGDIDIEYLLTESGKYRLKGYTHSVDKYSLKQASTIQGVGFVYKHTFENVYDLFNIKKAVSAQEAIIQPSDSIQNKQEQQTGAVANESANTQPTDSTQNRAEQKIEPLIIKDEGEEKTEE